MPSRSELAARNLLDTITEAAAEAGPVGPAFQTPTRQELANAIRALSMDCLLYTSTADRAGARPTAGRA